MPRNSKADRHSYSASCILELRIKIYSIRYNAFLNVEVAQCLKRIFVSNGPVLV